jgi:N-alpha-acetyl-L-2,4-diaminobutyrate deacetylase
MATTTVQSTIFTDIDFEKPGRQIGFLNLPHSPHRDAWGVVPIPICVIKNGQGPTVLLEGGNHGDEYEGPITLGHLIRDLDPAEIQGRLVIIPAINQPAVAAGRRVSPEDDKNFNRTFPGSPIGTVTEQISHYVNNTLFPLADAFIDLHSGGSSLSLTPSAIIEPAPNPDHMKRNIEAVLAFNAPLTVVISNHGDPRTSTASSVRAGLTTVATEMAGGGTVTPEALQICKRGVRNVLAHLGVLPAAEPPPSAAKTRLMQIPGGKGFVYATASGVFEPFHANGAEVREGEPAGQIHFLTSPGRTPELLRYRTDGTVYGRRQPGLVEPGNCCVVVVTPFTGQLG